MRDARSNDGLPFVLAVVLLLLLVVGGAFYVSLQQQQAVVKQRELLLRAEEAAAKAAKAAEAEAVAAISLASKNKKDLNSEIQQILRAQQQAWNSGNIEEFMQAYWNSPDLTFSSGGKVKRGWEATLEGYQERYPTKEQMGTLEFSSLEISPLGADAAWVLGEWFLTRDGSDIGGKFTLVFRRIDGEWVIVHDHTSRADSAPDSND